MSDTAWPASCVESKNAERSLRADERAQQVVARRVEGLATDLHELPVGQDELEPGDVVRREPVLEAVRAAGVLGHVAADRADDLARRIRRIEEARADRDRDVRVRHARLDADAVVLEVDLEHALHPRDHDEDAVVDRQRAAGEPRAGATGDPRHAGARACPHDARDLLRRAGEDGGGRDRVVLQQPVGLVGAQLVLVRVDPVVADDPAQLSDERAQVAG
jgi:hypothetical protein